MRDFLCFVTFIVTDWMILSKASFPFFYSFLTSLFPNFIYFLSNTSCLSNVLVLVSANSGSLSLSSLRRVFIPSFISEFYFTSISFLLFDIVTYYFGLFTDFFSTLFFFSLSGVFKIFGLSLSLFNSSFSTFEYLFYLPSS